MPDLPLPDRTDVLVVGAGLAGAAVALALRGRREVTVFDAAPTTATGASGAAAGLVNPFMGRKAKPAWRHDAALAALDRLVSASGPALLSRSGVLRPAASASQALTFRERAEAHPDLDWLAAHAAAERWPTVAAPHGALRVHRGGHVRIPALVDAALTASGAAVRLGVRLDGWNGRGGIAITDQGGVRYHALVLALGDGAHRLGALAALPLHRVKGQTVRLRADLPPGHPAVSSAGYVVPEAGGAVVGATFEHDFADAEADANLDAGLVEAAARLVPSLAGADVIERRAGVRLTVPTSASPRRLPLAGALPGHEGVFVLTGLGAKGLLMAPLLAEHLAEALTTGASMPPDVDTASVLG